MINEYCDRCNKITNCNIILENKNRVVDNLIIEYREKKILCSKCGNEFYNEEIINYNVNEYNLAYNKIFEPISISEIELILEKYDIGKKTLAKVLNWGEVTIIRYINGQVPDKAHSDILKSILNSYIIMDNYLEKGKCNISKITYKRVKNRINMHKLEFNNSKIYIVSNYILDNIRDVSPLMLQKLLYFIQGFSKKFLNSNIFDDNCEAWVNGPVYKNIYDLYSQFKYNYITADKKYDYDKFLSSDEIKYIDVIIKYFGCFSSDILMYMSHKTTPWKNEINNKLNKTIKKEDINKYFNKIINEYNINELEDIYKYSNSLFKEILNNKFD